MSDSHFKPRGLAFTWVSLGELVGTVLMFLLLVPLAVSAIANCRARTHVRRANDLYLVGDYVGAKQVLDLAIEALPRLYHAHEMLAMALYLQREPAQAEAEYRKLATSDLDGAPDRKPLAHLAVLSLRLIQLRAAGRPIADDPVYAATVREVKALALHPSGAYEDAQVVCAQVELDRLGELEGAARTALLEHVRAQLLRVEQRLTLGRGLSPWGIAVLYNSLGVVSFELGTEQVAAVERSGAGAVARAAAHDAAAKHTAAAVRSFRRALQLKLMWTVPFVNFEQALAYKLVERRQSQAERTAWIDYANDYLRMRDEHLGHLVYGLGLRLDRDFELDAKHNDYTLKNSLGWACSLVGRHGEASSKMRDANRVNGEAGIAHYNLARTRAALWKQQVGLELGAQRTLADAVNEARDTYRGALEHGGATGDPLRRCRLLNNMGVFWFKGLRDPDGGIRYLEQAKGILPAVLSNAGLATRAEQQGLASVIEANLQVMYQHQLERR